MATSLRRALAIGLCLLVTVLPVLGAPPDTPQQRAGQVNALIPAATRNAQPVKAKDDLQWNDLLQTAQSGRLRAGLTDGSILSLGSNSQLRVLQHDAASQQTSLEMNYGKLRSRVVKITQPNGKFEVKTPNAVIGVVGTDFYVGFQGTRTTVICYSGVVTVTPLAGAAAVTLNAGQMVEITNEPPPSGFQAQAVAQAVQQASMQDTDVPDVAPAIAAQTHLLRNLILGLGVAATGFAVGITQLKTNPAPPPPVVVRCPPNSPKCG
jgi:hypothetical protein